VIGTTLPDAVHDRMLIARHLRVFVHLHSLLDYGEYRVVDPTSLGATLKMRWTLAAQSLSVLVSRGYLFKRREAETGAPCFMLRRTRREADRGTALERLEARMAIIQAERALIRPRLRPAITKAQMLEVMTRAVGLCVYCSQPKRLTVDHIDPVSRGGSFDTDNLVACCQYCNFSKHAMPLLVWLAYRKFKAAA
jgi:5-methylcytosine-specific restriction enzyme A